MVVFGLLVPHGGDLCVQVPAADDGLRDSGNFHLAYW